MTDSPYAFLPYQGRWVADPAPVKVIEKSRRVGLSWAEAADDALYAAADAGDDVWYIGYNKEMAEEFINDCAWWVRKYALAAGAVEEELISDEDKDILTFRIRFASGHKVVALSSRPSNLRGKQGRVVIDEAAFHDDLLELLKAAMALLMWGGQVRIISTHNGDQNPFNTLIQDVRAGKKPYSLHRVTLDDALAEGLYRRICLVTDEAWTEAGEEQWRAELVASYGAAADEELFCIPSQGGGTYLARVIIERCMADGIPVLRWNRPHEFAVLPDHIRQAEAKDWCEANLQPLLAALDSKRRHYFGEDFARNGDLTVISPLAEEQGLRYRQPFVVELSNIPFKEQEFILFYIVDRLPRFTFGKLDARGNGQYLAEVAMQRYGASRIEQVMLSDAWYREEMPRMKAFFEDGAVSVARDADHMDDYRAIQMVRGVAKVPDLRTTGSSGNKRHGDAAIALAMAISATRMDAVEYAYHPVSRREHADLARDIRVTAGFGRGAGLW